MTTGLLLGCGLGAAVCLLLAALVPPRVALGTVVSRWERQRSRHQRDPGTGTDGVEDPHTVGWQDHLGQWMAAQLAHRGFTLSKVRADLEITDYTLEAHLVRKVGYGLVGLLLPSALSLALATTAGTGLPFVVPAVSGLALGAALFSIPDVAVSRAAGQRRDELRRALSCYLDLVAMSLAGGRGIPEALPTAARIGRGWAFRLLQSTIDRARRVGEPPWGALADLGRSTGMPELVELGGALALVADDGAKIRSSLTARASTARRRQLAEAEGAAAKADQSIELAQIVLAVGFLLFIGYPAVAAVLRI